jgi:hypothetical protein
MLVVDGWMDATRGEESPHQLPSNVCKQMLQIIWKEEAGGKANNTIIPTQTLF